MQTNTVFLIYKTNKRGKISRNCPVEDMKGLYKKNLKTCKCEEVKCPPEPSLSKQMYSVHSQARLALQTALQDTWICLGTNEVGPWPHPQANTTVINHSLAL